MSSVEEALDRALEDHLKRIWPVRNVNSRQWKHGRNVTENPQLRVLEIRPQEAAGGWVYASVGAWRSNPMNVHRSEFILLSPLQSDNHVELLTMVSTAYSDGYAVADGKVLEIGRAWLPGSACNYILVSAPYFLESGQEGLSFKGVEVSFLWLVPITAAEADFGRQYGGHSLFHKFAEAGTDLLQIDRRSIM